MISSQPLRLHKLHPAPRQTMQSMSTSMLGFGEREITGADAHLPFIAEETAREGDNRAFEMAIVTPSPTPVLPLDGTMISLRVVIAS